jgi:hypothetical protein
MSQSFIKIIKSVNIKIVVCALIGVSLFYIFVFAPSSAQAGIWDNLQSQLISGKFHLDDMQQLLVNVINVVLIFITWVTIIFMIIGGYLYITSAGNPEALERGKKTITGSVIAFILIIASKAMIAYLEGWLSKYATSTNLIAALRDVINLMLYPIGLIGILGLLIGGYQYIMAAGNPETLEKAKKTILYSVLGIIAIVASWAILYFIGQRFGLPIRR